jgi:hypothetical protein
MKRPNTGIDVLTLLDTTLLHELLHTTPAGGLDDAGRLLGSYGWANILALKEKSAAKAIKNAGEHGVA